LRLYYNKTQDIVDIFKFYNKLIELYPHFGTKSILPAHDRMLR